MFTQNIKFQNCVQIIYRHFLEAVKVLSKQPQLGARLLLLQFVGDNVWKVVFNPKQKMPLKVLEPIVGIGTETKPLGFYLTVIMTTLTLPFYCVFNYTFFITDLQNKSMNNITMNECNNVFYSVLGSVRTSLMAGSSFNITWHLAYPHRVSNALLLYYIMYT